MAEQPLSTPPRTPYNKGNQGRQAVHRESASASGATSRMRNGKHRSKGAAASPATNVKGHGTPPPLASINSSTYNANTDKSMSTPTIAPPAAYAGATFHASPAPATLPIPSFYSKSVPDSPSVLELRRPHGSETSQRDQSPTRPISGDLQQSAREESPLDFFFKADREEKARARSATCSTKARASGPFKPPGTPPATNDTQTSKHRSSNKGSINGIFAMELDGPTNAQSSMGPAFSTPYAQRIHAARQASQQADTQASRSSESPSDRSAALKAYLFSTPPPADPAASDITNGASRSRDFNIFPTIHDASVGTHFRGSGKSSGLRKEVTPAVSPQLSTPPNRTSEAENGLLQSPFSPSVDSRDGVRQTTTPATTLPFSSPTQKRNEDLKDMENNLRRILKLDSGL